MGVLYELLHKINIANFDELVTIKDTFKSVEDIFKKKCIPKIGFDTKNTDELIKLIANYKVNKLTEKKLEQRSPVVGKKASQKASNGIVDKILSEYKIHQEDDDVNVISEVEEHLNLVKDVKRVPFNPPSNLPDVPTYVKKFKGSDDLTGPEAIAAARREAATAAATAAAAAATKASRGGGKLAANYKSYKSYNLYKSTGKFVYILYKKKRIKRCVYVKAKGRCKYCKIDKEYILLSKLKVV
jgi:hypothetical protein